jgi:nucleoside-diphosphate-sugar epimerase
MKVLITGAGGRVGTVVCQELAKDHSLRLLDIRPIEAPVGEFLQGSVADWETVRRAVDGMEGVVHLAIHSPAEQRNQTYHEYMQDDVAVGVKGTDLLLYAAKEAGVRRFVYTSSLNVYSARYPGAGEFLTDRDEPLSAEHYGTIKWLAEELCRHYALRQGLSTLVLRFNSVTFPEVWATQDKDQQHPGYASTRVHVLDVAQAVRLALEKEGIPWGRCLISGANPEKRFDTQTAEDLIGFRARYGFGPGKMYRDGVLVDGVEA